MIFVSALLAGFLLGIFACGVLAFLLKAHKHPPPTLRHRNRDRPIPEVPVPWEREEGVDYRFINLTGEER